jgi:hypothetical protein
MQVRAVPAHDDNNDMDRLDVVEVEAPSRFRIESRGEIGACFDADFDRISVDRLDVWSDRVDTGGVDRYPPSTERRPG